MKTTTFKKFLADMGIHNEHGLVAKFGVKGKDVWVQYNAPERSHVGGCYVHSPSHKTDPTNSYWQDYGNKRFSWGRDTSMPAALAWVEETYKITEWVGSPFGGGANVRVPAYIVEAAKAAFKETTKATKLGLGLMP